MVPIPREFPSLSSSASRVTEVYKKESLFQVAFPTMPENNRENIRFKIEKEDFYLDGTGLGYKEVIRWINENGGMGILY